MKVLIAPAHYLYSDKYGSEPSWSVILSKQISKQVGKIDIIVGTNDHQTNDKNTKIYSIFSNRSPSLVIEFFKRSVFYILVSLKSLNLDISNYTIVHHMLPLSFSTINPLVFIVKIFYPKTKVVLGPAQAPYSAVRKDDIDVVFTSNKSYGVSKLFIKNLYFFLFPLVKYFSIKMWKSADAVVCVSKSSAQYYSKYLDAKKISVIPMGVVRHSAKTRIRHTTPTIITAGSLSPRKGHLNLLEACRILAKKNIKFKLVIVGEGELSTDIQKFINDNQLTSRIRCVGQISHDQMPKIYSQSDIYCLPSLEDSYPTVLMEAMQNGLPIVATDVGSVKEMVGEAGLIVPPNDSQAISGALQKIMNIKQYSKLSAAAISRSKYYDINEVSKQYLDLYQKLQNQNG